jgi:hypothetical protein
MYQAPTLQAQFAIGSDVWKPKLVAIGDHICDAVQGMNSSTPRVGTFDQCVGATGFVTMKVLE